MSTQLTTPILFVIFNRPDVAQNVFNQIRAAKPKFLYVAADGPRPGREDDIVNCKLTRAVIDQIDWDCELKTLFRSENLGCGFGVCSAITWFFEQVEEGIILEDDCLPDLSFFRYCHELLSYYKEDEDIYLISGTNLQNGIKRSEGSYYFSNYMGAWGWATWRRAWKHFVYEIPDFEETFKTGQLNHVFQSYQEKSHWKKELKKSVTDKRNIWDYQWCFAVWKNKGLAIIPNVNLITNIGFRNNASHTFLKDSMREASISIPMKFPLIHTDKKVNRVADQFLFKNAVSHSFSRFIRLTRENGIVAIVRYTIGKYFKK